MRLAATKALYNSLEFTKANFDKEVLSIVYAAYFFFRLKDISSCKWYVKPLNAQAKRFPFES